MVDERLDVLVIVVELSLDGNCDVKFIETKLQLADIFTKPLPKERFFFLRNELGILDSQNVS